MNRAPAYLRAGSILFTLSANHLIPGNSNDARFSELIISRFKVMFCVLIIFAVLCGSINIFWIFQTMSSEYEIAELLFHFMIIIIEIVYILTANYLAQEIIDHNNNIYVTVYNIQWYITPLQIQKMILFLLQRRTKEFNLNIAGLFVGSLEGAATMFSAILSYFTVLYSTQR
ncbi:uncharacterized protein LOC112552342 [Pogonomyrmex barbatus]|uniref:Uncharacterized protein LOC112552342 n=1 Tax=Pogonomyrmex barbatus TaxID=144034 RepID=A0A8N1S503_9HYME|nr:uncharacterized protein LOC112552342 [Pogonomyrmex barbatus]